MPLLLSAICIALLFFFMVVRPQKKNMQRHNDMINSLKVGDEIITSGGIYGEIKEIEDDAIKLNVGGDVVLKVAKRSIAMKKVAEVSEEA